MDLKEELKKDHSLSNTLRLVNYIGEDELKFAQLMEVFLGNEYRLTQRAAWIVGHFAEKKPALILPYLKQTIDLCQLQVHDAVKRNTLRVLQKLKIPEELAGEVLDWCFKIIENPAEAGAIRAFALTVAFNLCKGYPELALELKTLIETYLPHEKPAFVSRGKKILKSIENIII
jgi:hypothetical protein